MALLPPAADPSASPPPDDAGGDDTVLVTICKAGDGSYTVYAGDEPDEAEAGDMSGDDAAAMGPAGDQPAAQGQPADSIGSALKLAMDILNADKSSEGAPGNADDQFAAGFNGPQSPTPAGMGGGMQMAQKY